MKTVLLSNSDSDILKAAEMLKNGGVVGIPTETVYGLASDALNPDAVRKIFAAKGRPADNPLIVHISDFGDIERLGLVSEIPDSAYELAERFWPGPLTMIMKKSSAIPDVVSAGLDTVAVRFPSHPDARRIIKASGTVLAAPSANISGSPSPTTAAHVMNDMNGRIDAVVDGGACEVGLESTVITLAGETPVLLRPGGVTAGQLEEVLGRLVIDSAVLGRLEEGRAAPSPGMKYKHYAPKARVVLLKGNDDAFISYVNSRKGCAALCCDEDIPLLSVPALSLGRRGDFNAHAHMLFTRLREVDLSGAYDTVYSRLPSTDGVGMAVYNRLIRAAGFEVIDLEKI